MKKTFYLILLFMQFTLASCGESPNQLFETAELEMIQSNYPNAEQLFKEIIEKHPNSEFATKSRARLEELKAKQKR